MIKILGVMLALLALGLAGCSSLACGDPHPYLNSKVTPLLKAPAGMSVPAPDPAYAIAGAVSNTGKRTDLNTAGVCLINPPQVVPSAASNHSKRAEVRKSGATESPASKLEPSAKPAGSESTPAPSASTSGALP